MGDQGVIAITTEPHTPALQITTHWGGADIAAAAEAAITKARPRWNDPSYCTRVLVQAALEHLGATTDDPLGHGLAIGGTCDTNRPAVIIDIPNQRVALIAPDGYYSATDGLNTGSWTLDQAISLEAATQPGTLQTWLMTGKPPKEGAGG
jgi:hypothetical protein